MAATLKVHKWHAWNVCIRLVEGLHEPYQILLSAFMDNGTVNFAEYSESMHVCTHLVQWPQCHDCYHQQCCLHCKCMYLPRSLPGAQAWVLSSTLWWWYESPWKREGSCWRARWRQEVGHFHSHRRVWGCYPGGYVGGRGLWWQQEHLCACVYSNMVAVFNTTSSHKQ